MHISRGRLRRLGQKHGAFKPDYYYDHYEAYLALDPTEITSVLELGILRGGSLLMWMEFFPQAQIFGVDAATVALPEDVSRIHMLEADQTDTTSIGRFLRSNNVDTLDLVIDDCSHIGFLTKQSFWYLFNTFLKPGGYYVIEDWPTGYWDTWPDGAALVEPDTASDPSGIFTSHNRGIPGFVKQLIDRTDVIESIVVSAAFVVVKKQSVENAAAIDRQIRLEQERGEGKPRARTV